MRIASTLTYPAVVKPRKSVTYAHGVGHFGSAVFVHTPDELIQEYHLHVSRVGEAPLIQTRIAGEEYGVEMIARDGNPCALVTHHRMRSLRPTGGASVLKEIFGPSILRDTLEMHARRLVLDLEWNGPIMVEFKVDSDTREPLLMEVNGRFWGSLPLSVAAGVDMPYHFYEFATRGSFPSTQPGEPLPIVSRHFLGDCMHLARVLFSRDRMRPYAYPSRMHALRAFFSVPRGTIDDVWSRNDLRPGLYEIIDIVHTLWK
jgi:predicted ATP-grasp superfamily ATP-dependent carboligase